MLGNVPVFIASVYELNSLKIDKILAKLKKHFSSNELRIQSFGSDSLEDLLSELVNLLHEFMTQGRIWHRLQTLKLLLFFNWTHKCGAVSISKEVFNESPNPILSFDIIAAAFLLLQGVLEVLFRGYCRPIGIKQLQRKVTHHPEEGGEVLCYLIGVALTEDFCLYLELFRKIYLK